MSGFGDQPSTQFDGSEDNLPPSTAQTFPGNTEHLPKPDPTAENVHDEHLEGVAPPTRTKNFQV